MDLYKAKYLKKNKKKELQHIGQVLHDHVAPQFFISKLQLELLIDDLADDTLTHEQQQFLLKSWRALIAGYNSLRQIMHLIETHKNINPEVFFPSFGEVITAYAHLLALPRHVNCFMPQLPTIVQQRVEKSKKLGVCVAELLLNAAKHAQGARIGVTIAVEGYFLCLNVTVQPTETQLTFVIEAKNPHKIPKKGFGLTLMEERLQQWGGRLQVSVGYNNAWGTKVYLPLAALENEDHEHQKGHTP